MSPHCAIYCFHSLAHSGSVNHFSLTFFLSILLPQFCAVNISLSHLFCHFSFVHYRSLLLSRSCFVSPFFNYYCCISLMFSMFFSLLLCQFIFLTFSLAILLSHGCAVNHVISLTPILLLFLCHSCCPTLVLLPRSLTQSGIFHNFSATLVVSLVFCSPSALTLVLSFFHVFSVTLVFLTMFSQLFLSVVLSRACSLNQFLSLDLCCSHFPRSCSISPSL